VKNVLELVHYVCTIDDDNIMFYIICAHSLPSTELAEPAIDNLIHQDQGRHRHFRSTCAASSRRVPIKVP
jgi:hypothetical protein